jgi:hypothetical protein
MIYFIARLYICTVLPHFTCSKTAHFMLLISRTIAQICRCLVYTPPPTKKITTYLKGTVARDFLPLGFSTNRPHIVPEFTP